MAIHWGMGTREACSIEGYLKLFGGCHGGPDREFKVIQDAMARIADQDHPITTGIQDFWVSEEFYYRLKFMSGQQSIQSILTAHIDHQQETAAWA